MNLLSFIINKHVGVFFLCVLSASGFAQDSLLADNLSLDFSLNSLKIKRNNFYYNNRKLNGASLSSLINLSVTINQTDKLKWNDDIALFYKYKANKNASPIIASSSFLLGAAFSYLTLIEGGKTDVMIVSAIFGCVSIGFTVGSVVNAIKFKNKKKELIKQLG